MVYITAILFFFFIFLISKYFLFPRSAKEDEVPCLRAVPFLGSLPFISDMTMLHVFMAEKSKKLGNIIGFYLFRRYIVVLNGREAIHEALVKQSIAYSNRPSPSFIAILNVHELGIVEHANDDHFKKYHALSMNIMKQFGFGKSVMENRIKVEVKELLQNIDKYNGCLMSASIIHNLLTKTVVNVLLSFLFGKRMHLEDSEFNRMTNNIMEIEKNIPKIIAIRSFPLLSWIPSYKMTMKIQGDLEKELYIYFEKQILENINNDDSFIHEFISQEGPNYDKEQLNFTLRDLFAAGMETTASTLQWIIILLANHQDVQRQVQDEIDRNVDRKEMVSLKDKNNLPHLEAIILEAMRFKTLVPLSLPHTTTKDTLVQGKFIPANTWIMPNLYSVHMDADFWKDPDTFRPTRFLDEENNVINRNNMIGFSLGKRSCFGEILARQELFLFTGNLVQRYSILPPQGQTEVNFKEVNQIIIYPSDYSVRLVKRS